LIVGGKEPAELGYDFTIWTLDRLQAHMKKVKTPSIFMISLSGFERMMIFTFVD